MPSYIFQTSQGWGAFALSELGLRRLYIPVVSRAEALAEAQGWGDYQTTYCAVAQNLVTQVQAYFAGEAHDFSGVQIDYSAMTDFQVQVYKELCLVPLAETVSYGALAQRLGKPHGARAVGRAMSCNPVPLVIPCHRVLSSTAQLTGFTAPGGVVTKQWLLGHEASIRRLT